MSGICGIIDLSGKPVEKKEILQMTAMLDKRGPDGSSVLRRPNFAFGHTLLVTTPEAKHERLPLEHSETGCAITADARLDNREYLLEALQFVSLRRIVGDAELILNAYLKWGEGCAQKLVGDFAFAIWDPRSNKLVCARDRFGVRQLVYRKSVGKRIWFATDPAVLASISETKCTPNIERVADYLGVLLPKGDLSKTWFEEIENVPPSCFLVFTQTGTRIQKYWELSRSSELKLSSNGEYVEAFSDIFQKAVRSRLRSPDPVGVMLSGGLDSGSVSFAAEKLALEENQTIVTYSALGENPTECEESMAILRRIATLKCENITLQPKDVARIAQDLASVSNRTLDPFDCDLTMLSLIYAKAGQDGCKVVLDGAAGDLACGAGPAMAEFMRRGKLLTYARETANELRHDASIPNLMRNIFTDAFLAFMPTWARKIKYNLAYDRLDRSSAQKSYANTLHAQAAVKKNLDGEGVPRFSSDRISFADARARSVTHTSVVGGRGCYDRIAGLRGVEPRDPFLDQDVVEFCLSLPPCQFLHQGTNKAILKGMLNRQIEDDAHSRGRLKHVGWSYNIQLVNSLKESDRRPATPSKKLDRYISKELAKPGRPKESDLISNSANLVVRLFRMRSLEIWLEKFDVDDN